MKFIRLIPIFIITLITVAGLKAQDETIRVETELVTVNVAVTDKQGKPVKGLSREQFEIFDNKSKQQISHFSAEDAPVSFGIVYDMHPTSEERTNAVLDSLRAFTKDLGADDRFFVVAFDQRGFLNTDFIPTTEQLQKNLKTADPRSLYDAIYLAADKLRASRNLKRAILVISDSADHNSRHSLSELRRQLKNFDVQIYAVIFDESEMWTYSELTGGQRRRIIPGDASRLERAALQDLTLKSGGSANFPMTGSGQELFKIYKRIETEMREFYTLSFYPTAADGNWHELRINLRSVAGSGKFALTYRPGYQSLLIKR